MTEPGLTPEEDRVLRARIDALPGSIEPARDLWPDIRGRIDAARAKPLGVITAGDAGGAEAEPSTRVLAAPATSQATSRGVSWPRLAAAAAVLIVSSVSLTWLAIRPSAPEAAVAVEPTDPMSGGAVEAVPSATALATFASYERSAADLATALEQRAARLDPATRDVLDRSLRTIDEALSEARAALAADPASAAFQSFVDAAYRQKLDFLRRANDLAALQGA